MRNYIKCFLNDEVTYLPISKSDSWLSDYALPYDLIETCDGRFYEVRKSLNGALVAYDITDLWYFINLLSFYDNENIILI